ncbi:hypothetical protein [Serratia fonticola]|uniref:Fimbrial protein n=1 Tax=Serratia fonticola TaxID=47917 RepID=A0ABY9PS93_SERFO|nr:hypothetical protein [Serratia fonticola]WMT15814.1 hypothetical protein RFB13_05660 [Serratia fonticola]
MIKQILGLILSVGSLFFSTAYAWDFDDQMFVACLWEPDTVLFTTPNLFDITRTQVVLETVKDGCWENSEGETECSYKQVWRFPSKLYATTSTAKVSCVNFGNKTEQLSLSFYNAVPKPNSLIWKNLTLSISGAGAQRTVSNIDQKWEPQYIDWIQGSLAPCSKNCSDFLTATPRFTRALTLQISVQPSIKSIDRYDNQSPFYDLQEDLGRLWMTVNQQPTWSPGGAYVDICGLDGKNECISPPPPEGGNGGGGGGPPKPPLKQCTLTVVTPDVVVFQPISSDDLSRGRVRSEDFTMTVTKGPEQSLPCIGSAYNLPGEIKTQGGYSIGPTFWGINHSSGTPQGIGLRLYDLGKGSYLRFNSRYPSFISDISTISESKRIRAEISATTKDLKKIKDGTYSQVLTFEVVMP